MSLFNTLFKLLRAYTLKSKIYSGDNSLGQTTISVFRRWKSKKDKKEQEQPEQSCPDGTFTADEMEISILPDEKLQKKAIEGSVKFGRSFTDYMFSARWDAENGWGTPKIDPISNFRIHPASKCLHYGVEVIEGMQAYRGYDSHVRLFRPDLNMKRLLMGAKRMCLPSFDPNEFAECIKRLVKLEQDWIPDTDGSSLYIRPVFLGVDPSLRMSASKSALLYVILCPLREESQKPMSLYADPRYAKSWPGGCGNIKMGGNYGQQIFLQRIAEKHGCHQILWLNGKDHNLIDIGNMNIFFVIKNSAGQKELVTPPLNGLILDGVIRQSIIELCKEWKEFGFSERNVSIEELKTLLKEKRVKEVFGSGTTKLIAPINSILYEGSKLEIPTSRQDKPVYRKIRKALSNIQYGKVGHEWGVMVDDT